MVSHTIDKRVDAGLSGAYIELATLLSARFAATDLKLQQRRKALSLLAGPNKTNFRGRGIDFEEVRAYQAGDDIRTIDWRVTARSGKPYTKLFREERERPLLVVTDQRQPMFFGSQHCFKSVMACYLGALIAWAGLNNGDRVGGLVFGNQAQQEVRPRRSRQSALALMHVMRDYNRALNRNSGIGSQWSDRLASTLIELRRIARPGSAIYLISDFSGFDRPNVRQHLHQLSRHCEITGLFIFDTLERQLPPPGQYAVTDGSKKRVIQTAGRGVREHYTAQFDSRLQQLHNDLGQLGIPLIEVATSDAPLARLMQYYGVHR